MTAVTGIILCGGRGRRLAGADKPLLIWRGEALIAQVARRLATQADGILISANRNLDAYRRWGTVVADELPGHQGPLAGIAAALAHCTTPWALVCPGDAPLLPSDLGQRLVKALRAQGKGRGAPCAAMARTGARLHPLHCLLHRGALSHLTDHLASGQRTAQGWLNALGAVAVDFSDQKDAFRNFNSGADFAKVDAEFRQRGKPPALQAAAPREWPDKLGS